MSASRDYRVVLNKKILLRPIPTSHADDELQEFEVVDTTTGAPLEWEEPSGVNPGYAFAIAELTRWIKKVLSARGNTNHTVEVATKEEGPSK